jgi:broad specificity phosphatase PhoE
MGVENHRLLLLRHGETEWSKSGQHTGRTEIELTDTGRAQAMIAGRVLGELKLDQPLVVSSPRQRALDTARLADIAIDEISPLVAEWDYGSYEGLTTAQIREIEPDWLVWTPWMPGR